ncbi:MAG: ketoacyl-ACP synthase III [Candidatus Omnitrophica bacterium]|jgi:3-oxoacyl-[acyl-carrier-protein] synthase-3|nr:ketoacyl-ACP synthase III [Candidatus Omnitrophota bacterium]
MNSVGIIGIGKYLPKKVLTNQDLEKMVDTSDEWITTRTGIQERRIAAKNEACSDLALKAAQDALSDSKINPLDLDLIIVATVTADMHFPSVACIVQSNLGAKNAICFDVSAACAGFIYALIVAKQFIARGSVKHALVIGSEVMSYITDWTDRNTCVLFGDGSAAAVLGQVKSGGIIASHLGSDGSVHDILNVPAGGSRMPLTKDNIDKNMQYIKMRGNELFKMAVNAMSDAAKKALEKAHLKVEDVNLLIPHQANQRIIAAVAKKLNLSMDKVYLNIARYGNMSSASVAVALCEAVKEGRIKKGDIIVLDSFGAGLVWAACVIKW